MIKRNNKEQEGTITREILELIPSDGWISAAEIAEKLNITPYKVSSLIGYRLLHKYVKRKAIKIENSVRYLYSLIPTIELFQCRDVASDVHIQNVVTVTNLNQNIDLLSILKAFRNAEYNPSKFPGLFFRLERQKAVALIFRTGKMICTGVKSEEQARNAIKRVISELNRMSIIVPVEPEIVIQNGVATANLHGKIDLEKAAYIIDNVIYEPEQFPSLVYRMEDPKVVISIFGTGKITIAGGRKEEDFTKAVDKLRVILMDNELIY